MSKLLSTDAFYQSFPWLEPSIESLLESPIAELSLDSKAACVCLPGTIGSSYHQDVEQNT